MIDSISLYIRIQHINQVQFIFSGTNGWTDSSGIECKVETKHEILASFICNPITGQHASCTEYKKYH